jgi:hypothetical protein
MEDERLARIFALLQKRWLWPVPALVTSGLILLFSSRAWVDQIGSRRGPTSVAVSHLYLNGFALFLYAVVVLGGRGLFLGGGRLGMRQPTEAEEGCVLTILQLMVMAIVYANTYNLLDRYVFH